MPKIFVDVDLVKSLIKCYNPVNKTFHRKDRSVFLSQDKETFIEVFDLGSDLCQCTQRWRN